MRTRRLRNPDTMLAPRRLPDDIRLGPVHLRVRDLEAALAFYEGMLGMHVHERQDDGAILGAPQGDALVHLHAAPDAPPRAPGTPGLYHVAILLPERAHLARLLEHFAVFRQPLSGAADHAVSEAIYLEDPEGNGLEIYADRPRETWTWDNHLVGMTTKVLDIDDLLATAGNIAWNGMPGGTQVGHVHLESGDVGAALAFYRDVMGFSLTATYAADAVFLSAGGYHHHVAVNAWGVATGAGAAPGTLGLQEIVLRLPDAAALDALATRLAAAGSAAERTKDVALRFADPAGHRWRATL